MKKGENLTLNEYVPSNFPCLSITDNLPLSAFLSAYWEAEIQRPGVTARPDPEAMSDQDVRRVWPTGGDHWLRERPGQSVSPDRK